MATYTQGCSQIGDFSYAKYFTLYVVLTDKNGNPDTNKSQVDYNVYCQSSGSGSISANHDLYFILNGKEIKKENVYVNVKSPKALIQITSGTLEIEHDDDGSKKISFSASIKATGGYGVSASLSDNFDLTTIPRASSVTCNDANIESSTTININRAVSSFTHTIIYQFGTLSGTIVTKTSNTSIGWTIPSSFYAQIPNSKTGTGTIKCITYNGDSEIGQTSTTFIVTASEDKCKPTLSAIVVDTNTTTINLTGNNSKIVKYKSTAKITITTSAKNSASISNKKVNNINVTGDNISITNIESNSFVVTVTDSRGYSNSITLKPTIVNYIPLTINATIKRMEPTTGEVGIVFSGNYYNGSFGSVNNALTLNWYYREKGSSTWISGGTLTKTITGNTYNNGSSAISLGKIFDYQKSYEFYLKVADKLTTLQPTYLDSVPKGTPIFNWGEDFFKINVFLDSQIADYNKKGLMSSEDKKGLDKISDLIKLKFLSKSVTVDANSTSSEILGTLPVIEGYTYVGMFNIFSGYADQWIVSYSEYGGNVVAKIHSSYANQLTADIKCCVLYIKDEYLEDSMV